MEALKRELEATERRAAAAEHRAAAAERRAAIVTGAFYTTIGEVWDCAEVAFPGAFDKVRRDEKRNHWKKVAGYETVVKDVLDLESRLLPKPRLDKSANSSTTDAGKPDIFGKSDGERAHMIPNSKTCAPTYGVFAQAILGVNLEENAKFCGTKHKTRLIPGLQQLACGHTKSRLSGLKNLPLNLLRMPMNHRKYFDDNPFWIVVPILSLDETKAWETGREYWVMVIAGTLPGSGDTNEDVYNALVRVDYDSKTRKKCTLDDIETATTLLGDFVKAHADVLKGRQNGRNGKQKKTSPLDLFQKAFSGNHHDVEREINQKKYVLENTARTELKDFKVKVPKVKNGSDNWEVMKVLLNLRLSSTIPDPALVATKAAINWSARCGQRLLPACPAPPHTDQEEDELDEIGREQYEAALEASWRPTTPTMSILAGPRRVTLSPEEAVEEAIEGSERLQIRTSLTK